MSGGLLVNGQAVLIISDSAHFARDVVARWQMERLVPEFTVKDSTRWNAATSAPVELAIVGGLVEHRVTTVLRSLESLGVPTICVVEDVALYQMRSEFGRVVAVRKHEDWLDSVMVIGNEVLRRVDAVARAKRAESAANINTSQAALGKYMLEARHGFNNALTSVLGNAELLMLETTALPEGMRQQIDTIHNMALRLHEMMQRFSSLETEMYFAERESHTETKATAQAYLSGT
jgi:signal transduction histidine kinase